MKFKDVRVTQVLVGRHRVGLAGLAEALKKAADSGLASREEIVDLLVETLAGENYLPDEMRDLYRTALWREYLRFRGEDFSDFFSEIECTVRGEDGEERDRFVDTLRAVFAELELAPVIEFEPAKAGEANPQLVIHDETIVRGTQSPRDFREAVHGSISDW